MIVSELRIGSKFSTVSSTSATIYEVVDMSETGFTIDWNTRESYNTPINWNPPAGNVIHERV